MQNREVVTLQSSQVRRRTPSWIWHVPLLSSAIASCCSDYIPFYAAQTSWQLQMSSSVACIQQRREFHANAPNRQESAKKKAMKIFYSFSIRAHWRPCWKGKFLSWNESVSNDLSLYLSDRINKNLLKSPSLWLNTNYLHNSESTPIFIVFKSFDP